MSARGVATLLVPLLALGGTVAATRVVEARQASSGRTSLYERARAWQSTVTDARGIDPAALSDFYVPASLSDLSLPRALIDSRLARVAVSRGGMRGVTTHLVERRTTRGFRAEAESVTLTWVRRGPGDAWRILDWGRDD